jgi:hypothetical protein
MKATPFQLYLRSLRVGAVRPGFVTKDEALRRLKKLTGEDYGLDIERWRVWGMNHPTVSGMWPLDESEEHEMP